MISVKIERPLGLVLEELRSRQGVYIQCINEGSNAYKTNKLYEGLRLVTANEVNVEYESFDFIMNVLVNIEYLYSHF